MKYAGSVQSIARHTTAINYSDINLKNISTWLEIQA